MRLAISTLLSLVLGASSATDCSTCLSKNSVSVGKDVMVFQTIATSSGVTNTCTKSDECTALKNTTHVMVNCWSKCEAIYDWGIGKEALEVNGDHTYIADNAELAIISCPTCQAASKTWYASSDGSDYACYSDKVAVPDGMKKMATCPKCTDCVKAGQKGVFMILSSETSIDASCTIPANCTAAMDKDSASHITQCISDCTSIVDPGAKGTIADGGIFEYTAAACPKKGKDCDSCVAKDDQGGVACNWVVDTSNKTSCRAAKEADNNSKLHPTTDCKTVNAAGSVGALATLAGLIACAWML